MVHEIAIAFVFLCQISTTRIDGAVARGVAEETLSKVAWHKKKCAQKTDLRIICEAGVPKYFPLVCASTTTSFRGPLSSHPAPPAHAHSSWSQATGSPRTTVLLRTPSASSPPLAKQRLQRRPLDTGLAKCSQKAQEIKHAPPPRRFSAKRKKTIEPLKIRHPRDFHPNRTGFMRACVCVYLEKNVMFFAMYKCSLPQDE